MALAKKIYKELQNVVRPENISENIGVLQAYSKQPFPPGFLGRKQPDAVVLPESTRDVQAVLRLANRYKFACIPTGNYNWDVPRQDNTVILDFKKMNRIIKIDQSNMYAVVEPGVTHAQLQAECMKRGLVCNSTWGGSPCSVLANTIFFGVGGLSYRFGFNRVLLSMEWVLPSGEVMKTGSEAADGAGYFWPEGPGPDLRGLVRAFFGVSGGLGIITRIGVKLMPWPGPATFPVTGKAPNFETRFPKDRFRFHLIRYASLEEIIEAMYAIGEAEIAAVLQRFPSSWFQWATARSKEEFWKGWESGYLQKAARNVIAVWLVGFSSKRQLEFEEKVLQQIIKKTGGEDIPPSDRLYKMVDPGCIGEWFQCGGSGRVMRPAGTHMIAMVGFDSIDHSLKVARRADEIRKKFDFMDDDENDWVCTYDFGWQGDAECLIYPEQTEDSMKKAMELAMSGLQASLQDKTYTVLQIAETNPILGPAYGNYHELLKKIKKALDPQNISNPPNPIQVNEPGEK
jgi:FAD/FMN-containing dehydrogenase